MTFLRRPLGVLGVVLAVTLALLVPAPVAEAQNIPTNQPTSVAAAAIGASSVRVTWDFSGSVSNFALQRRTAGGQWPVGASSYNYVAHSARQYDFGGLHAGTSYDFRVAACGGMTESSCGAWVTAGATTLPATPTISVEPADRKLIVTWNVATGASSYKVQWKSGSQDYDASSRQNTVTGNQYRRSDITGLTNGTTYTVRVIATGASGDSAPSAEVMEVAGVPPPAPSLTAAPLADGSVQLHMTRPEAGISAYRIEWKKSADADWSMADGRDIMDTEAFVPADVSGLDLSASYDFRARTTKAGIPSAWSPVRTVAGKPASPQNFTAEASTTDVAVNLFWDFPSLTGGAGLTGYTVAWRPDATGNWVDHGATGSKTISATATNATVSAADGLAPSTAYNFRISVYNAQRRSYWTPGDGSVEATTASTGAAISATNPATLYEGNLHGARLTVDLIGATYVQNPQPAHFGFSPSVLGLSVADGGVERVDDDTVVLTLRFVWSQQSMTADTNVSVVVGAAATSHSASLTSTAVLVDDFVTSDVGVVAPGAVLRVTEGSPAAVEVALSKPVPLDFEMTTQTANGTAVAPGDFPALTAADSVTISPGPPSVTIPVQTNQDAVDEDDETFEVFVTLSTLPADLQGKVRLDPTATSKDIIITDDDTAAGAPTGLSATVTGASILLSWSPPSDRGMLNGSAAAISGYQYRTATSSSGLSSATWTNTGSTAATDTVAVSSVGTYWFQVRALNGVVDTNGDPAGAASNTASAQVTTAAIMAGTDPSPLAERMLDGARLTVDLLGTRYASSLSPGQFALQPQTAGLSVVSVRRVSDTRAVLTLGFSGNIGSDLDLSASVGAAANAAGVTLTTSGVMVSPAPAPDQVAGVTLVPGPGSLEVSWQAAANADGYVVQWKRSSTANYDDRRAVSGGSTTRTSLGELRGETGYDVRVYATSRFAADGPVSLSASQTTQPADAVITATDPSPLSETNLGGATLTVEFLGHPNRVWHDLWAGRFTVSGIPGVSVAAVEGLSDRRALVRLAYDASDPATDFDEDATLLVRIDGCAFDRCGTHISAVTTVRAVDEPPPGQVTGVRLSPGPMRMGVTWNEVGDATGYRVEWSPPAYGWTSATTRRPWHTSHTIGRMDLDTEYTVRVVATKTRAPDGQPSGWVSDRTPRLAVTVARTEPSPLREDNLHRARVTVDLEGIAWVSDVGGQSNLFQLGRVNDCSWAKYYDNCRPFIVNRRVVVAGVERISGSRVIVTLRARRGVDLGGEGLWLRFRHQTHIASVHRLGEWLVVPVISPQDGDVAPPGQVRFIEIAAHGDRLRVSWDGVRGAEAYIVQWRSDAQGYDTARQARVTETRHRIVGLVPGTRYVVRVRAWTLNAPDGAWSEATATTRPFSADLSRVDPSPLTEANLDGAALTIDLEGAQWAPGVSYHTYRIGLEGVPGLRLERIELPEASRTRALLHLAHDGADFDADTTLVVRIGDDAHTWHGDITLTTPVTAIIEPETAQSRQPAPDEALPLEQQGAPDEALPL